MPLGYIFRKVIRTIAVGRPALSITFKVLTLRSLVSFQRAPSAHHTCTLWVCDSSFKQSTTWPSVSGMNFNTDVLIKRRQAYTYFNNHINIFCVHVVILRLICWYEKQANVENVEFVCLFLSVANQIWWDIISCYWFLLLISVNVTHFLSPYRVCR